MRRLTIAGWSGGVSDHALSWSILLFMIIQPIAWIKLPGAIDLSWICLLIMAVPLGLVPQRGWDALWQFVRSAPWLHAFYLLYLIALNLSASGSWDVFDGVKHLFRAYLLFAGYLLIGANVMLVGLGCTSRTVRLSVPWAVAIFAIACTISMAAKGENILSVMLTSLQSGDPSYFTRKFTRAVFSFSLGNAIAGSNTELEWEGARNTVGASFVFLASCWAAFYQGSGWWRWMTIGGIFAFAFGLSTLLMSRSAQLSIALGLISVYVHYQFSSAGIRNRTLPILICLGLVLAAVGLLFVGDSRLAQMNMERFTTVGDDARMEHYRLLWNGIIDSPLTGQGLGTEIGDGRKGHNLLLAAWFRAGMAGGVLALLFYAGLVYRWLAATFLKYRGAISSPYFNSFWLPTLMVGPIFRRMISGDDGRCSMVEWAAIAFFIAAIALSKEVDVDYVDDEDEELVDEGQADTHQDFSTAARGNQGNTPESQLVTPEAGDA